MNRLIAPLGLAVVWLGASGAGLWLLQRYEARPGTTSATPLQWPTESKIKRPKDLPLLVMFAHPQCPCTRTSIDELNRLLARAPKNVAAEVFFFDSPRLPVAANKTASWQKAATIPGVVAQLDADGLESGRFGAETSGFVVLYDQQGKLLFRGGITAGRGHAGDNAGEDAILAALNHAASPLSEAPVFGCALLDRSKGEPVR